MLVKNNNKRFIIFKNGQSRGNMFPSLNNIGDSEMEIRDSIINMENNFGPSAPNLNTINDLVIYNSFKSYGPNDSAAVFNSDLFSGVNDITNLTITNSFMNFNDQTMFRSLNDVDTFTIISNDLIEPYGVDVTQMIPLPIMKLLLRYLPNYILMKSIIVIFRILRRCSTIPTY